MRKTIRKVTIVVPVLITSCHVSEKWNLGQVIPQTMITARARRKAVDVPVASVALRENFSRSSPKLLLLFPTMRPSTDEPLPIDRDSKLHACTRASGILPDNYSE